MFLFNRSTSCCVSPRLFTNSILRSDSVVAPAKDVAQMHQIAFNDYVNSGLTVLFLSVVVIVGVYGLRVALKARKVAWPTAKEVPAVYRNEVKANEP